MSIATVIIHEVDGNEQSFVVEQGQPGQAEQSIRRVINEWSGRDNTIHGVVTSGKALGQRITVQLGRSRRTAAIALRELEQALEKHGMRVCAPPSRSRDFSTLEAQADIGLNLKAKPAHD